MPLRPSRYLAIGRTVFRHPSGQAVRPVLHTATARVFLADLGTAARLEGSLQSLSPSATDARDQYLVGAGLLVEAGRDETAEVLDAGREAARNRRSREFVVMPSAYCNMACGYCGQQHDRRTISGAHRAALATRVDRAARSGRYDLLHIRWFGGEPLMGFAVLRDLSASFIASAEAAGVGYTAKLITNGVLLDARKLRALHQQCRIGLIEVTLDGPEQAHDMSRPVKRRGGSFAPIVAVLAAALDDPELAGLRFLIRTNVGAHNAGLAEPFAAELAAAGLAHDRVICYPAAVHPWGNDVTAVALTGRQMSAAELAWFHAYRRHGLRFPLLPSRPVRVVCTATSRHSEVVAPDARVYSCTEQPLVPGLDDADLGRVGDLDPGEPRPPGSFDDWYDTVAAGETPCRDCVILPLCGGACPKLWREGSSPCPPLRGNLYERLDLYAIAAGCKPDSAG